MFLRAPVNSQKEKRKKANTEKEMELSFNYQGMAWTVHHH